MTDTEQKVREVLTNSGRFSVAGFGGEEVFCVEMDRTVTDIIALITAEKIAFAESCVPKEYSSIPTTEAGDGYKWGYTDARTITLENIRRGE